MTEILSASPATIARAAALLRAGGLVAFPTETVYGLGADATDDRAVARIFQAKGRPRFNPLICHLPDLASLEALVEIDARVRRLAQAFWPGPVTLVLPRRPDCPVSLLCSAGLESLAVRLPEHPIARALLHETGRPLAAPSANASGKVSPTTAPHVMAELKGKVDLILDGGPCRVGLESTVVDLTGEAAQLLRPGGLPSEDIEAVIGALAPPQSGQPLASPGMLTSHYAPGLALRLNVLAPRADEGLLAFGPKVPEGAAVTLNLSPRGDLAEAAANLFAQLRALDRPGLSAIAAMPIPETGLGRAINDRLRRAAAPRTPAPAASADDAATKPSSLAPETESA